MNYSRLAVGLNLAASLTLTACATTPTVKYTPVYCLSQGQIIPVEPPKVKSQLTGQADKDLEIVAGSAVRLRAWGEGLQTILEGCEAPAK